MAPTYRPAARRPSRRAYSCRIWKTWFTLADGERLDVKTAFQRAEHPSGSRIAIRGERNHDSTGGSAGRYRGFDQGGAKWRSRRPPRR
jgi:hypothetical protein